MASIKLAMFHIDRIVVPTDLSTSARWALDYAGALAERTGAAIHLLHVELLHGDVLPDAEARLIEWAKGVSGKVPIEVHVSRAVTAAPAILELADDVQAGLIAMGTHGRRGVSRVLLGSVATEVVQHAQCAVLTVRGMEGATGPEEPVAKVSLPPKRILVPIDFSPPSRFALRQAKAIAGSFGSELMLLHVVEDRFHPAFYGPGMLSIYDVDPEIESKAKTHLERLLVETEGPSVAYSLDACPGNPAREIVTRARRQACDLIVLSTHGLTGLEHFFLGSVAERVVRLAHCPVLTMKSVRARRGEGESPEANG